MKRAVPISLIFLIAMTLPLSIAFAANNSYRVSEVTPGVWDGTDGDRNKGVTSSYAYTYGDESTVTVPWTFEFYGKNYNAITADTNGNVWFESTGSAHSIDLASTGRGPVISAWNNDLSSHYYGGVFLQRKTDPDRIVIEWQTETYTEEGFERPNMFEAVLFPDGSLRLDYQRFNATARKDFGSGLSRGDGTSFFKVAENGVYGLEGRSFTFQKTANLVPSPYPLTQLHASYYIGEPLGVYASVANKGLVPAGGFYVDFYLSSDTTITASDVLIGRKYVESLAEDQQVIPGILTTTPAISEGSYYVGGIVDAENSVAESETVDNSFVYQFPIRIYPAPDLVVTAFTAPATTYINQVIPVQVTVKNQGTGPAQSFYVDLMASTDSVITADDRRLRSSYVNSLSAGSSITLDLSYSTAFPHGEYLGVIADAYSTVVDSDRTNNASSRTITFSEDVTPPVPLVSPVGGVFGGPVTASFSCNDVGSGCSQIYYSTDGTIPTTASQIYTGPFSIGSTTNLKYFATDQSGNASGIMGYTYTIDMSSPETTAYPTGGLYNSPQSIWLNCTDPGYAGCSKTYYTTNGAEPNTGSFVYGMNIPVSETTTLKYFSVDKVANAETVKTATYIIDTVLPSGTVSINVGAAITKNPAVVLSLSAADLNGVTQMRFSSDNVTWSTPEAFSSLKNYTLVGDGMKTVYVQYKDTAGNWSNPVSSSILLDTVSPVTAVTPAGGSYNSAQYVTLACADGTGSGCSKIYYTVDGTTPTTGSAIYSTPIAVPTSTSVVIKYFSTDLAGNMEALKSQSYVVTGYVKIPRLTPKYFPTIQAAYNDAVDGETILCSARQFTEDFKADRTINLTIYGGYDDSFVGSTGTTLLKGEVSVLSGAIFMKDINIMNQ